MIEAESLSKRYGHLMAVEDVSFKAERGDVLGFLGPNGAGKTTTMRILTGFMPATDGRAVVAGYDVFERPREVKRRIGYLPERPPLYKDMVVRKFLEFVAELKGLDRSQRSASVAKAIDSCGLEEVADRLAGHLSKGFQQRLGIAQAVVHDPEVLILDEPTIGLDPRQIVEMRDMIRSLAGDRTVILSSHILAEISQICSRVVIIHRGKIVAHDSIDVLRKSIQSAERVKLRVRNDDPSLAEALKVLPGVKSVTKEGEEWLIEAEPDSGAAEAVAKMVLDKGWGLEEVARVQLSLEDVFLHLVDKAEAGSAKAIAAEKPAEEGQ